ncbi:hypothetical protein Rrhod_2419 [Rhodococcus rhodnii LMG 5362]|uniref:Uncharacterized protein n=1 Tax=Rhodococcus rhodnii LMG 5362 TaxID=1273125 RepID=R7WQF3_9NOCA|nr:hypothetical protein Rrhod_2419 [Rhodococcus rhodnii LMG 5362]
MTRPRSPDVCVAPSTYALETAFSTVRRDTPCVPRRFSAGPLRQFGDGFRLSSGRRTRVLRTHDRHETPGVECRSHPLQLGAVGQHPKWDNASTLRGPRTPARTHALRYDRVAGQA